MFKRPTAEFCSCNTRLGCNIIHPLQQMRWNLWHTTEMCALLTMKPLISNRSWPVGMTQQRFDGWTAITSYLLTAKFCCTHRPKTDPFWTFCNGNSLLFLGPLTLPCRVRNWSNRLLHGLSPKTFNIVLPDAQTNSWRRVAKPAATSMTLQASVTLHYASIA